MNKKQKILFSLLLTCLLIACVYLGYRISEIYAKRKLSTTKVEIINFTDENVIKNEVSEVEEAETNLKNNDIIEIKENTNSKSNNSSASSNKTQKSSKIESKTNSSVKTETKQKNNEGLSSNKTNDRSGDRVAENNVVIEEKKDNPIDTTKEEEKKEETSKTIEIVIEEPKKSDYENDPEYLKMKKELFPSNEECTSKGIELSFKDKTNIASTMCTSESYKGKEVGYRLFIRYKDGTYKEYKK